MRLRMTNSDRGIGVEQKHGGWLSYYVAAPHHHGFTPLDRDAAPLQNFHDATGSAGHQPGPLRGKKSDIYRMEAVDILRRVNSHQHFFGVDLRRQRKLYQDAVDVDTPVQFLNQREQFRGRTGVGRRELLAVQANFFTRLDLAANIDL